MLSEARRAESKIDQAIKNANKIDALIPKVEKAAKDLGVDPNSISELKSSKLAIREASEYKKVLSTINKFISYMFVLTLSVGYFVYISEKSRLILKKFFIFLGIWDENRQDWRDKQLQVLRL